MCALAAIARSNWEIEVLRISTDERTWQQHTAESGSNWLYERPGHEATLYLVWLCQHIFSPHAGKEPRLPSLSVDNILDICSALAIQLANMQVPDSLTTKKYSHKKFWNPDLGMFHEILCPRKLLTYDIEVYGEAVGLSELSIISWVSIASYPGSRWAGERESLVSTVCACA